MRKQKNSYHHGNLAESLLQAVDEIATKFGLEAVTLRACAKLVGVSPSSAFRHYSDKKALMTAFATRALDELNASLEASNAEAAARADDTFTAVGLAYIEFALKKPAFFRAMWREEGLYTSDEAYQAAAQRLSTRLKSGFADALVDDDPTRLSPQELLVWSSVHGLANLLVEGPVGREQTLDEQLQQANAMLAVLKPAISAHA